MKISKLIPLIGAAIFIYILVKIGLEKITSALLGFNYIMYWGLMLIIPLMLFQLYKWNLFLKKQNIRLNFWQLFRIMSIGNFYGFITPAQLGAMVRARYIRKYTSSSSTAEAFPTVVIERLLDLLAVFLLALLGIVMVLTDLSNILSLILSFFMISILLTILILKKKGIHLLLRAINFFTPKKVFVHINGFLDLFYKKMFRIRDLIYPMIVTVGYWIAIFSSSYAVSISYGINVPWFDFITIFAISTLVGLIPITASGLGTREATLLLLISRYGSPPEIIISMSIAVLLLYTVIPALIGAIFSLCEK